MTERETIRQLAKQESARRSETAQQGSREMSNEQTGRLEEQLKQIHDRLDHIERNLILQQPNVIEFTKQVYPHIEAVIQKCETAEQKQLALEKVVGDHEARMLENWQATDEIVERQKTEFTAISERLQGMAVRDLQGYHQEICNNMTVLLAAEKKCEEALAECRGLAQQVGQTYETASTTIEELAETATKHVNEVKDNSAKAIDQARAKFVKTFRRLDTTLWDHPILSLVVVAVMAIGLSAMTALTLNRFTRDREINQSIEASTTATQEALKPLIEKIEKQTQNLDVIYEKSEAFELYLKTLPVNQRDKKRAELIEGAKKQKVAEDVRRRAD